MKPLLLGGVWTWVLKSVPSFMACTRGIFVLPLISLASCFHIQPERVVFFGLLWDLICFVTGYQVSPPCSRFACSAWVCSSGLLHLPCLCPTAQEDARGPAYRGGVPGGGNSSSRCFSFLNSLGSAFGKGTIQSSLKQLRSLIVVAQLWIMFLMLFFFPSNLLL